MGYPKPRALSLALALALSVPVGRAQAPSAGANLTNLEGAEFDRALVEQMIREQQEADDDLYEAGADAGKGKDVNLQVVRISR